MPLFMDRHVMEEGLTPEMVAQLHSCDLKVQDKYGVKYLTYWWHEGASAGFCLLEAPNKDAAEATHREAHGKVATHIIEVDWNSVEGFLGRVQIPASGEAWEDIALKTILCVAINDLSDKASAYTSAVDFFGHAERLAQKSCSRLLSFRSCRSRVQSLRSKIIRLDGFGFLRPTSRR